MIKSKGEKAFNIINVVIMLTLFAVFVFPYVIIVSASFSGERALAKYGPGLFIRDFSFASYRYIFSAGSTVARSLGVSVYITLLTTGLSVLVNSLLAYPLSRHGFFGKKALNIYVVITMLFGGGMVPFYLLIEKLNLLNNLWSLILPVVTSAWNVILLRNYFAALPDSLEESARIEGAGSLKILFGIYIPLSASVIATVALFAAVNQWNSWTVVYRPESQRTVPDSIRRQKHDHQYGLYFQRNGRRSFQRPSNRSAERGDYRSHVADYLYLPVSAEVFYQRHDRGGRKRMTE